MGEPTAYKVIAKRVNWKGKMRQCKKRVYTSLEDFNKYGIETLNRYLRNYDCAYSFALVDGKWIKYEQALQQGEK